MIVKRGHFNADRAADTKSELPELTTSVYTPNLLFITLELINAIQSTYLCTPYKQSSIDLIQAVARQYKFAFKVTKTINWNGVNGIVNGIRQYNQFLAIIKDNPGLTAVPTIEIGKFFANRYFIICNSYSGELILNIV